MTKNSSSSESPPSFLSLPHDIVFNTLARISRTNYPVLSLVSKSFRSLLSSPELEAARSLIGRPEKYLHVCLNLNNNKNNPNPRWFILSERKLIPTPSFPYRHLNSSCLVSTGSETYVIGGGLERSKRVFLIDCKTHQWRELPSMRLSRKEAVAEVMDGKIYVIGGCSSNYSKYNGEVYNPNTQTWEFATATKNDLLNRKSRYSSTRCFIPTDFSSSTKSSLSVLTDKQLWLVVQDGELRCCGSCWWTLVTGLEAISSNYLISVTNSGQDKRVLVWWKTNYAEKCETEIWCAQILIKIWGYKSIQGFIEWSENVFTYQGCHKSDDDDDDDDSEFLLHSAFVSHDY